VISKGNQYLGLGLKISFEILWWIVLSSSTSGCSSGLLKKEGQDDV